MQAPPAYRPSTRPQRWLMGAGAGSMSNLSKGYGRVGLVVHNHAAGESCHSAQLGSNIGPGYSPDRRLLGSPSAQSILRFHHTRPPIPSSVASTRLGMAAVEKPRCAPRAAYRSRAAMLNSRHILRQVTRYPTAGVGGEGAHRSGFTFRVASIRTARSLGHRSRRGHACSHAALAAVIVEPIQIARRA